jgi:hypothetical protein
VEYQHDRLYGLSNALGFKTQETTRSSSGTGSGHRAIGSSSACQACIWFRFEAGDA